MERNSLPAQPNNSLINGFKCLQQVLAAGAPIGSRELARRMGLAHTRVNRLVGTLAHLGLVERDKKRKYRPGPAMHVLAAQSMLASQLLPSAVPVLMKLRSEGFTVALGVRWEDKVCYLFHERPWQNVEEALFRHRLWPAQHSAIGVALIAADPGPVPDLPDPGPEYEITVENGFDFGATVARTRAAGYSLIRHHNGEVAIGTVIGSPPYAGLAISGRHIGDEHIPQIAVRMKEAASAIAERVQLASRELMRHDGKITGNPIPLHAGSKSSAVSPPPSVETIV